MYRSRLRPCTETRGSRTLNLPFTETRGSLFFILTLYWDERVINFHFWTDLVLREGRFSSFWPCIERGSFFFILTLYWDERVINFYFWTDLVLRGEVVVLHFDLILRQEGHKFWIELTCTRRDGHKHWFLNWPCTETRGSLFFILTLY